MVSHLRRTQQCRLDYYRAVEDPFSMELLNRYERLYPGSAMFTAGSACTGTYRALKLWEAAVNEAGSLNQADVVAALDHARIAQGPGGGPRASLSFCPPALLRHDRTHQRQNQNDPTQRDPTASNKKTVKNFPPDGFPGTYTFAVCKSRPRARLLAQPMTATPTTSVPTVAANASKSIRIDTFRKRAHFRRRILNMPRSHRAVFVVVLAVVSGIALVGCGSNAAASKANVPTSALAVGAAPSKSAKMICEQEAADEVAGIIGIKTALLR